MIIISLMLHIPIRGGRSVVVQFVIVGLQLLPLEFYSCAGIAWIGLLLHYINLARVEPYDVNEVRRR